VQQAVEERQMNVKGPDDEVRKNLKVLLEEYRKESQERWNQQKKVSFQMMPS